MTTAQNTATLDLIVNVQGSGMNNTFRLATYNAISLADSPGVLGDSVVLSSGANTLSVKQSADGTYAQFFLLLPDPSNSVVVKVKTTSGDVGVVTTNQPVMIPIPSGTTSIYLNAASGVTVRQVQI